MPITITLKSNVCERHLQARRIFTEGTKQYNTLGSCREQWEQFVYKIFGASIDYSQSSAPSSQSSVIKQLVKGVHCIMPLLTSSVTKFKFIYFSQKHITLHELQNLCKYKIIREKQDRSRPIYIKEPTKLSLFSFPHSKVVFGVLQYF